MPIWPNYLCDKPCVRDCRGSVVIILTKILEGVKTGKTFSKWGNTEEKLLNGVICVKNDKTGGKTQNSLLI
jgi:hypothetical protein